MAGHAAASSSPAFYDFEGVQLAELDAEAPKIVNKSPRRRRHKFDPVVDLPGDYDSDGDELVARVFAPDRNGKMRLVCIFPPLHGVPNV